MAMYVQMCETPCLVTYGCQEDYEWDNEDLITSPFVSVSALFHVTLLMGAEGPTYSTLPEKFNVRLFLT